MAWMQGARRRPIKRNYTARTTAKDCILLHVTGAPNATSQHGWFNTRGANASSHFHVDLVGNIEQYIDSDHMSWANRDGNPRSVTIETQGGANGEWTTAQVRAIRSIIQWVRQHHPNIPLRQMTSSRSNQHGIGWHRLGCNGNFPTTGILRGRTQRGGGELWSGAFGKVCPGDDRIRQVPAIIRQAGGHWTPATTDQANRQATPTRKSWFDMASLADLQKAITDAPIPVRRGGKTVTRSLGTLINNLDTHVAKIDGIPKQITDTRINVKRSGKTVGVKLGTLIAGQDAAHNRFAADLAALREVVDQLATGQGVTIDYDRVEEAARAGAAQAIQDAQGDDQ